jgi:DNA-binding response OmpR family regulator
MLLKLRQLLLEKEGFSVLPASSVEQALGLIADGGFDLLMVGCDVDGPPRELLLRQCSKVPTLVLYCGNAPDVAADSMCDCLEDPRLLVNTIQALLLHAKSAPSRKGSNGTGFTRIALERGIAVSVCKSCYRFITYGSREQDLKQWERAHVCPDETQAAS